MKTTLKLFSALAFGIFLVFSPAFAAEGDGYSLNVKLENPIAGTADDVPEVITLIIDIITLIAIPVLTIIFIYSGFLFVTAMGDKAKLAKAKSMFLGAVIGTALILGANAIAEALQGTIEAL